MPNILNRVLSFEHDAPAPDAVYPTVITVVPFTLSIEYPD